jgi:hypothetical protein
MIFLILPHSATIFCCIKSTFSVIVLWFVKPHTFFLTELACMNFSLVKLPIVMYFQAFSYICIPVLYCLKIDDFFQSSFFLLKFFCYPCYCSEFNSLILVKLYVGTVCALCTSNICCKLSNMYSQIFINLCNNT